MRLWVQKHQDSAGSDQQPWTRVSCTQHLSFLNCQMGLLRAQPRQVKVGRQCGKGGWQAHGENRGARPLLPGGLMKHPLPPSRKNQSY